MGELKAPLGLKDQRPILERERELARVGQLLAAAGQGNGRVLVVEGAAGIGKSALLAAAGERAEQLGSLVLRARGGELEVDLPFALVRQLFEAHVTGAPTREKSQMLAGAAQLAKGPLGIRSAGAPAEPAAALYGLYWLLANIAERRPTVLVIDDVHWADTESLRWLAHLTRRIDELGVLTILAARPAEHGAPQLTLDVIRQDPLCDSLRLEALGLASVASLVAEAFGAEADDAFNHACHHASGGNPFLLRELLRAAMDDGIAPVAASASLIRTLGSATVARSVLVRLARLGNSAVQLGQAVAVLGSAVHLRTAAAVAELAHDDAAMAAAAMQSAEILAGEGGLEFIHPLMRAAVYHELVPAARARLHARAARVLSEDNDRATQTAAHLLASEPLGDPWVVATLIAAGADALARGAPDAAVRNLRRALVEPPVHDDLVGVLTALGTAELIARDSACIEHLDAAFELASNQLHKGAAALALCQAHLFAGAATRAHDIALEAFQIVGDADRELALRLRTAMLGSQGEARLPITVDNELATLARSLPGQTPAERGLIGIVAWYQTFANVPADDVVGLCERALVDGHVDLAGADLFAAQMPAVVLLHAGRHDRAQELIDELIVHAQRIGSRTWFSWASAMAAYIHFTRGELGHAELRARDSLGGARDEGFSYPIPLALAALVSTLVERGELAAAQVELAAAELPAELTGTGVMCFLHRARGTLALALHRHDQALAAFEAARDVLLAVGCRNPALVPWRSEIALILNAAGDRHSALSMTSEEVALAAEFGVPGPIGMALRTQGLLTGDTELLAESVATLEGSEARLEHARSLVAYGAALRRSNRRSAAREPLRHGLDLAQRCGATVLAETASQELRATGARPRRHVLSGIDALTASERRVAEMAASGLSNPEIAQALFVTRKTVEKHLGGVYSKLDIQSRDRLSAALSPPFTP